MNTFAARILAANDKNVKMLIQALKRIGVSVKPDSGDDYTLVGKDPGSPKLKAAAKEAGWKQQAQTQFPDGDGNYYLEAKSASGFDSQAVLNFKEGTAFLLEEGNW